MHTYNTKARTILIDFILSIQEIKQIQADLKIGQQNRFQEDVIVPTKHQLNHQLEKLYPSLIGEAIDILNDVYYRMKKEILKLELNQNSYELGKILWSLFQKECKLAQPTTANKSKNFDLTRSEFKQLCTKLKNGNESLIEKAFLSHYKLCVHFLVKNEQASFDEADEATKDALLEIRKDLMNDKILYGNLSSYFTYRAKLLLFKKRRKTKEVSLPENSTERVDDADYENDAIKKELNIIVSKAINKLCDECKLIVKLYYYEEITLKEIAVKLNKSHDAIRKSSSRCRDKLRAYLGENFYKEFSSFLD